MQTKLARFTSKLVSLAKKAVAGVPSPAIKNSCGRYADWVIFSIRGLKEYLGHPYRQLLDALHEMPRIVRVLGLRLDPLPDFSTLCRRKQQLRMPSWRALLQISGNCHDLGEVQAIDATGVDRVAASRQYANQTNYTFKAVKMTIHIDCTTGEILDIHCSMKQSHDNQIGW